MANQLEAYVELDGEDYSLEIGEFVLNLTRNSVTEMPTYGNASEVDRAGTRKDSLTLMCKNELAADTVARLLYATILTDDAEIPFVVRYSDAVIGVDNPEFAGNLVVTSVQIGNKVGENKVQSQTFSINSVVMTTA